jgi:hypothetical protein
MPERRLDKLAHSREHNAEVLRATGWSVAEAGAADSVPDVWSRVTAAGPGARPRMTLLPQGGGT